MTPILDFVSAAEAAEITGLAHSTMRQIMRLHGERYGAVRRRMGWLIPRASLELIVQDHTPGKPGPKPRRD